MARKIGSMTMKNSLEPTVGAPLDGRLQVKVKEDLYADGSYPKYYNGMIVSLKNNGDAYKLSGVPTNETDWKRLLTEDDLAGLLTEDDLAGYQPTITVDDALSDTSENPVQNKVIKAAIDAAGSAGEYEYNVSWDADSHDLIINEGTDDEQKLRLSGLASQSSIPSAYDDTALTARVSALEEASGSSGTSDYPDLTNKPQINGVELSGNKTSEDLSIAVLEVTPESGSGYNGHLRISQNNTGYQGDLEKFELFDDKDGVTIRSYTYEGEVVIDEKMLPSKEYVDNAIANNSATYDDTALAARVTANETAIADRYTKSQTDEKIAEAMTDVDNEHFHPVTVLPDVADAKENHEYILIEYEQDGETIKSKKFYLFYDGAYHEDRAAGVSIDGYATEQYVDDALNQKADTSTTYTKAETDTLLEEKVTLQSMADADALSAIDTGAGIYISDDSASTLLSSSGVSIDNPNDTYSNVSSGVIELGWNKVPNIKFDATSSGGSVSMSDAMKASFLSALGIETNALEERITALEAKLAEYEDIAFALTDAQGNVQNKIILAKDGATPTPVYNNMFDLPSGFYDADGNKVADIGDYIDWDYNESGDKENEYTNYRFNSKPLPDNIVGLVIEGPSYGDVDNNAPFPISNAPSGQLDWIVVKPYEHVDGDYNRYPTGFNQIADVPDFVTTIYCSDTTGAPWGQTSAEINATGLSLYWERQPQTMFDLPNGLYDAQGNKVGELADYFESIDNYEYPYWAWQYQKHTMPSSVVGISLAQEGDDRYGINVNEEYDFDWIVVPDTQAANTEHYTCGGVFNPPIPTIYYKGNSQYAPWDNDGATIDTEGVIPWQN